MATSVLSARSAAVTMSSESASSCSVIGSGSTGSDAEILVGRPSVTDRQLLSGAVPAPARAARTCLYEAFLAGREAGSAGPGRTVIDRQLLVPSPMWHLFRTLDLAMPATDRLPGTLGPYRLQDRLGEGGMGVVHLARDPQGGLVAVKVLRPDTTESANARLRLAREVETMQRVRSAFVAEVL